MSKINTGKYSPPGANTHLLLGATQMMMMSQSQPIGGKKCVEVTLIVAVSNQPILSDTGHEIYKLPHMSDAACLAESLETGIES